MGPDGAAAQALESDVVDVAQKGLEEESGKDDDAHDGVGIGGGTVQKASSRERNLDLGDEIDAEGSPGDKKKVADDLCDGMDPDGEAARDEAHKHGADGHDGDDGNGGKDAVDGAVVHGILEADAGKAAEAAEVATVAVIVAPIAATTKPAAAVMSPVKDGCLLQGQGWRGKKGGQKGSSGYG